MQVDQDEQEIIARVAALDVGKAEVVCCVRVPGAGPGGRRVQEVRTFTMMTRSLRRSPRPRDYWISCLPESRRERRCRDVLLDK